MKAISLKLEDSFLSEIDKVMSKHRYMTKTEFIREAIRDKIKDLEKEEALLRLEKAYGASKRKTTDNYFKRNSKKSKESSRSLIARNRYKKAGL